LRCKSAIFLDTKSNPTNPFWVEIQSILCLKSMESIKKS
jgi:hypothetical protein